MENNLDTDENIVREIRRKNLKTREWEETNCLQVGKLYFIKRKGKIRQCKIIGFFQFENDEKAKILYMDTMKKGDSFL